MAKKFWEYFINSKDKVKKIEKESSESGSNSGSASSSGGTGTGRIKPPGGEVFPTTYLVEETEFMQYERRGLEQQVERQLASVEERRKPQRKADGPGPGQQEKMKQHPLLDSQRFDGIDPSLNPAPFGNQEAMIQFENERREQEMDKQLRLGNMPKMGRSMTPEPRMGG